MNLDPHEELRLQRKIYRTLDRLESIKASSEHAGLKAVRATVDLCDLLKVIAAACLSERQQAMIERIDNIVSEL